MRNNVAGAVTMWQRLLPSGGGCCNQAGNALLQPPAYVNSQTKTLPSTSGKTDVMDRIRPT